MEETIILYSKRGRPRLFTPEQQAEKFRVYMRKYMKKRFDEEKALRPPKDTKQTKQPKPYKGRPSISDKEREEKIEALISATEFKECKAPKKEKPSKEYFRKYYETHRDSLLNRANLRYHKKVIATRREEANPLIAERVPASAGQSEVPSDPFPKVEQ
jgi:hypothetical protein